MSQSSYECTTVIATLGELCASVRDVETRDEQEEPVYVQLLEFLRAHSACQHQLEAELESLVLEFRHAREQQPRLSIDALAFCMHSLRWPGVLRAMQREHREFFVPRMDDFPWRLIDAYSPTWEGRAKYAYYDAGWHGSGSDA